MYLVLDSQNFYPKNICGIFLVTEVLNSGASRSWQVTKMRPGKQAEVTDSENWSRTSWFHPIDGLCFAYIVLKENFIIGQHLEIRINAES